MTKVRKFAGMIKAMTMITIFIGHIFTEYKLFIYRTIGFTITLLQEMSKKSNYVVKKKKWKKNVNKKYMNHIICVFFGRECYVSR